MARFRRNLADTFMAEVLMINTQERMKDELRARMTGRFVEGKTELDLLSKPALCRIFKKTAKDMLKKNQFPPLTKKEEEVIRDFYRGAPGIDLIYHRIYKGRTGHSDPAFMPDDLYYRYIAPYYTPLEAARYVDNKTMYYQLFRDAKLPELICMRMGTLWFDGQGQPVKNREIPDLIRGAGGELVLKQAENSETGAGVFFLDQDDPVSDFRRRVRRIPTDVVVQRAIEPHPDLKKLNPSSANSLRIMSFLRPGGAQILMTCVRVGVGNARTDNLGTGGFFLGVDEEGRTRGIGAMHDGSVVTEHPVLHYPLKGNPIPGLDKAYEMVKKLHPIVGQYRLVAWDVIIDTSGDPVLLET